MYRLFAALPVPEDLWPDLDALHADVPGARWRQAESYHITLCFFGDLSHAGARDLDELLAGIRLPAFDLGLEGAGWFGRKAPESLHVRVSESEALRDLASACERAARRLGLEIERGPYVPHVTLAYLKETPLAEARRWSEACQTFQSSLMRAGGFHLYSSHKGKAGNHYIAEADYPLD